MNTRQWRRVLPAATADECTPLDTTNLLERLDQCDETLRQHDERLRQQGAAFQRHVESLSQRLALQDERLARQESAAEKMRLDSVPPPRPAWPVEPCTLPAVRCEHPANFHQGLSRPGARAGASVHCHHRVPLACVLHWDAP